MDEKHEACRNGAERQRREKERKRENREWTVNELNLFRVPVVVSALGTSCTRHIYTYLYI